MNYCGTSLTPQIIKLNINDFGADIIYSKDDYSGWMHGIANDRSNNLYFIYSSNTFLPEGVKKINVSGDLYQQSHILKNPLKHMEGRPCRSNGNIWLWKGYP